MSLRHANLIAIVVVLAATSVLVRWSVAPPPAPVAAASDRTCAPIPRDADGGEMVPYPDVHRKLTQEQYVRLTTDLGPLEITVYPEAAPAAARRFLMLVQSGFYDHTPIFRVVPGFVAQFGINSDEGFRKFYAGPLPDEPSDFQLTRGTLAFAKAGPNTADTQVFINYGDNSILRKQGGFTAFAVVRHGIRALDRCRQAGEPGMGLDQSRLKADTPGYLKTLTVAPTMIEKARLATCRPR